MNIIDFLSNKFRGKTEPMSDTTRVTGGGTADVIPVESIRGSIKTEDLLKVLQDSSSKAIKRFKQEILAQKDDMLERAIRKYQGKIARRTWKVAQKWCKWGEDGPILYPDHTRLYYRRGKTEIMVMEYSPQVRLLRFNSGLMRGNTSDNSTTTGVHSFSLALPYLVIMHKFCDGLLNKTLVTFCDRPLKHLKEERPMLPFLSNISSDLRLCHGSAWKSTELIKDNLTQQIAYTMDLFWSTVYCDEWSGHFWAYKKHFQENGDKRFENFETWQQNSIDNPLFVIEDVNWIPHTETNYGNMLVRMFDTNESVEAEFRQELYNDLVDNFIDEMKESFMKSFGEVEEKVEQNFDEAINSLLLLIKE